MLHHIVKWSILATVWRRYGTVLKIFPFAVLAVVIIFAVHADYVNYATLVNNQHALGWSLLVKWLLVILVVFSYVLYVKNLLRKDASSGREHSKSKRPIGSTQKGATNTDPFAGIREKESLRTRADVVLKEETKK